MKNIFWFLAIASFVLYGCQPTETKAPDVSHIDIDPTFIRFEKELTSANPLTQEKYGDLSNQYPVFSELFFTNVLPIKGEIGQDSFIHHLNAFMNDSLIQKLFTEVNNEFSSFQPIQDEIKKALRYYQHYFPDSKIPNIYTYISEYSFQKFIFADKATDGIGIGLDMFLGENYPYKKLDPKNPAFSEYLTRRFNKDHIALKVIQTMLEDKMGPPAGPSLLDRMIHNGKKLYIQDQILPFAHDSIVFEYSESQLQWCKENELEIWAFLFDNDLFYETRSVKINKYVDEGPDSPGMPAEAPGRTANFMGYQIVNSYMNKNSDASLEDLIAHRDAQKFLEQSKYKPKRK